MIYADEHEDISYVECDNCEEIAYVGGDYDECIKYAEQIKWTCVHPYIFCPKCSNYNTIKRWLDEDDKKYNEMLSSLADKRAR